MANESGMSKQRSRRVSCTACDRDRLHPERTADIRTALHSIRFHGLHQSQPSTPRDSRTPEKRLHFWLRLHLHRRFDECAIYKLKLGEPSGETFPLIERAMEAAPRTAIRRRPRSRETAITGSTFSGSTRLSGSDIISWTRKLLAKNPEKLSGRGSKRHPARRCTGGCAQDGRGLPRSRRRGPGFSAFVPAPAGRWWD